MCSKFIACYGIATILDPLLLFIVDLAYHNYNCSSYSANCNLDYTSDSCSCFNGDFIKLFNRTVISEGSGVTGVILVVIVYFACAIVSTLLLYEYLVYVHKDARILDLWRRVKGPAEEFFVPDDSFGLHTPSPQCPVVSNHIAGCQLYLDAPPTNRVGRNDDAP